MPDANYAVSIMQGGTSSVIGIRTQEDVTARTAGAFTFGVFNTTFGSANASQINVAVFR